MLQYLDQIKLNDVAEYTDLVDLWPSESLNKYNR